jgi:hypothetical protein
MQLYSQGVTAQHAADFRRVGGKGNIVNWAQSWDRTGAAADAAAKARSENGYKSPWENAGMKTPSTAIAQSQPSRAQRQQVVQQAAKGVGNAINQGTAAVGRFGQAAASAWKNRPQAGKLTGGSAGTPVTGGPEKVPMPIPVTGGPPKGENAPAQFDPNEPVDISHMPPEVLNQLGGQAQVPKGMLQQFMQQHGQALQAQYGPDIIGKLPQDVMSPEMQNQQNAMNPEKAPAPTQASEKAPMPTAVPEQAPAPTPTTAPTTPPAGSEGAGEAKPAPTPTTAPTTPPAGSEGAGEAKPAPTSLPAAPNPAPNAPAASTGKTPYSSK